MEMTNDLPLVPYPGDDAIDIVIALDCSAGMEKQLEALARSWDSFRERLLERAKDYYFETVRFRVKLISFGGTPYIKQSPFFTLPEQARYLTRYLQSLPSLGPCECAHALEATYLALHSDWQPEGRIIRRCVFLLTDKPWAVGQSVASTLPVANTVEGLHNAWKPFEDHPFYRLIPVCADASLIEQLRSWKSVWPVHGTWDRVKDEDLDGLIAFILDDHSPKIQWDSWF